MKIKFGHRELKFPGVEMGELRSSNDALENLCELQDRLYNDGYLLLRDFLEAEKVLTARAKILDYLNRKDVLVKGTPVMEGIMPNGTEKVNMEGATGIMTDPVILEVLENPKLFTLFTSLFNDVSDTYKFKWLRTIGNEEYTGAHYDTVYMGRGSKSLHTVWIPFGEIAPELGSLAICKGSNHLPKFDIVKRTYGRMDVDKDRIEGWFSKDPMEIVEKYGGQWQTTTFRPGDAIIFGMFTMHASTTNLTNRYRLSCDVRFQPQNEKFDDRWAGRFPDGHKGAKLKPLTTMEEARVNWGV